MRSVCCWSAIVIGICCSAALAAQGRSPALPPEAPPPLYRHNTNGVGILNSDGPRLERWRDANRIGITLIRQQSEPDDGFRPVSELPPDEKLPAGPMLVGAYVFVVLALFAYFLSLSRRLTAVNREIGRLDAQIKRR